ncbi:33173_t:CDS:1, partial [Gigaspora margarita]
KDSSTARPRAFLTFDLKCEENILNPTVLTSKGNETNDERTQAQGPIEPDKTRQSPIQEGINKHVPS